MTYFNPICADVGTRNCPCPLAETGDCLVCSRLSGARECSCRWAGVCVYNEYMQNGSMVRTKRKARSTGILQRLRQGDDLLMLQLRVPRGFALEASRPGSFLFLKPPGAPEMTSVPVSVMAADVEHESLRVILKIISAKTKALAACEDFLEMRGIYRSGLLGKGAAGMLDLHDPGNSVRKRWLILTKGVGFAPAVNLIRWAAGRIDIHVIADPEKVGDDVIRQQFRAWRPEGHSSEGGHFRLEFQSLAKLLEELCKLDFHWIRLHYLYPDTITDELIDTIAAEPKICKYIDMPIQHCNDTILKAMRRRETHAGLLALMEKLRAKIPDVVLRTSLITGLPYEDEAAFDELCEFLRETHIERAGVFPYSPEEGTDAAEMPNRVDTAEAERRAELVADVQSRIMDDFNESRMGDLTEVLCEGFDPQSVQYIGRSYAESPDIDGHIYFTSADDVNPGDFVTVRITGAMDGELVGEREE